MNRTNKDCPLTSVLKSLSCKGTLHTFLDPVQRSSETVPIVDHSCCSVVRGSPRPGWETTRLGSHPKPEVKKGSSHDGVMRWESFRSRERPTVQKVKFNSYYYFDYYFFFMFRVYLFLNFLLNLQMTLQKYFTRLFYYPVSKEKERG